EPRRWSTGCRLPVTAGDPRRVRGTAGEDGRGLRSSAPAAPSTPATPSRESAPAPARAAPRRRGGRGDLLAEPRAARAAERSEVGHGTAPHVPRHPLRGLGGGGRADGGGES